MKKRIATLLSASMILSSLVMPATTLEVFADGFEDDTVMVEEISDDEFVEEDDFEDEFEIETETFEKETGDVTVEETETESETKAEVNSDYIYSGKCGDDLNFTFANGTLTITGTGPMDYWEDMPWRYYCGDINKVVLGNGITYISKEAFFATNITEITIPNTVTRIDEYAFGGTRLKEVDIPDSVTSIGAGAFQNCNYLTSVKLPKNLEEIEAYTFYQSPLKSITFPVNLKYIFDYAFSGTDFESITIPDSVVGMGPYVFDSCKNLKTVKLGNKLDNIPPGGFNGCENLTTINIPNTVESIDMYAFKDCKNLVSIQIPDGVYVIGYNAFENCSSLKTINIPNRMGGIASRCFKNCESLKKLELPENVDSIGSYAFAGCKDLIITVRSTYTMYLSDYTFAASEDSTEIDPGLKILCYENSSMHAYAEAHGIPYMFLATKEELIGRFVKRMYSVCLERSADKTGLEYWVNLLKSGKESGASAAHGFVFSNEANAKNLCNSCFLNMMYSCFMGRTPDEGGKNYWLNEMSKGKTRADVFEGFVVSNEFKKLCGQYEITLDNGKRPGVKSFLEGDCKRCGAQNKTVLQFIERMYTTCLGRGSDKGGRQYWLDQLKKGKTGLDLALGFLTSDEIKRKNLSDSAFIDTCYKAFFGRNADKGGKDYWLDQIKKGKTREDLIKGFAASNEFQALCREYGIPAK